MVKRPVTYYLDGRLYEWTMAASMILFSIMVLTWPTMLRESAFQWLVAYLPNSVLAFVFLITGLLRVGALLANGGSLWIGPWIRSASGTISAVLWSQFTVSLVQLSILQGHPSPGLPFWLMFTFADLYVSYRAVLDVRTS